MASGETLWLTRIFLCLNKNQKEAPNVQTHPVIEQIHNFILKQKTIQNQVAS